MQPICLPMPPHGSATATELAFDVQIFPGLGLLDVSSGRGSHATVVGLLATGVLFLWEQSPSGDLPEGPGSAVRFYDLSAQLHSHGSPTALGTSGGTLLLGCSDGVVLGLPHAAFFAAAATPQPAFELRTTGWGGINRLISGMFSQSTQPPVAACLSLQLPDRPPLALIVYDDCTVRAFSLDRGHQEVFSENLSGPSGQQQQQDAALMAPARRLVVASAMLCSGRGGDSVLVATLESCDFSQKHTWLFSLGGAGGGRIGIQSRRELAGLSAAATVVSASLDGDTVWVLARAQGAVQAAGFSRATGQLSTAALLHEQQHSIAFEDADQSVNVVTKVRQGIPAPASVPYTASHLQASPFPRSLPGIAPALAGHQAAIRRRHTSSQSALPGSSLSRNPQDL